ncbi:DUF5941 domain-containing protein [Microbispora bryophytorum]|uniref:DUF5941 domain-containing protein n=1 Tax=Microbispora bryophytorum TaxID=1460882 RepID=A0A8H9LC80_9ACTN|nr:DUF5941 domain-containing protein [Microbispora bryophytorum]MBD3136177.1 hypothetical protein [Microbispora bryophytorum]TQS07915.1 hypothetical protein FLX07_08920 [Microbispora bryophytorum]GGO04982.1 hypothetical protein GCM10011574_16180 [Microbispora bryophytorum]
MSERSRRPREAGGKARGAISVHMTPVPSGAVVAYRDDGPLSKAMGLLVAGQLPPLPPALAGAFVTGVLLVLGIAGADDFAVFAPAVALLLAGAGSAHRHDGRLDWLAPPILRLTEYGFIASAGFARSVPPALIVALLGAMAFHHYDTVYRLRQHVYAPPWLATAGLGWDGRMLIVALGGLLDVMTAVFVLLAVYLWALFGWESLTCWLAAPRTPDEAVDPAPQD